MDLHGPGIDARGVAFAGREPVRADGPRPGLRLERHLGGIGQRRHVRRGAVRRRQVPLPLQGQVPAHGEAGPRSNSWEPNVIDTTPGRLGHADRRTGPSTASSTPYGTVERQAGRVRRPPARTYFHEARLGRSGSAQFNDPGVVHGPERLPEGGVEASTSRSTGRTPTPKHTAYFLSGAYPQRAPGHVAGLPGAGHRQVRLAGLRPQDLDRDDLLGFAAAPAGDRPGRAWCRGTTSRPRTGRRPTSSGATGRCTARR